ncbi:MAG: hypothetical protein IJZ79_02025 [Bacilli bacterium]|nr:hypothetical protein [Bacilli bacterium]
MKCTKCKHENNESGMINIKCLECRHQYPGQECYDKKPDLFEAKEEDNKDE